jgi:hypothetical protein
MVVLAEELLKAVDRVIGEYPTDVVGGDGVERHDHFS